MVVRWRTTSHQRNAFRLLTSESLPDCGTVLLDLAFVDLDRTLLTLIARWELNQGGDDEWLLDAWAGFSRQYDHASGYSYRYEVTIPDELIYVAGPRVGLSDDDIRVWAVSRLKSGSKKIVGVTTLADLANAEYAECEA